MVIDSQVWSDSCWIYGSVTEITQFRSYGNNQWFSLKRRYLKGRVVPGLVSTSGFRSVDFLSSVSNCNQSVMSLSPIKASRLTLSSLLIVLVGSRKGFWPDLLNEKLLVPPTNVNRLVQTKVWIRILSLLSTGWFKERISAWFDKQSGFCYNWMITEQYTLKLIARNYEMKKINEIGTRKISVTWSRNALFRRYPITNKPHITSVFHSLQ